MAINAASREDRAAEFYAGGATTRQIADHFGVDDRTVRRWLHQLGVDTRGPGRRPDPELPPTPERKRARRTAVYAQPRGPLPARKRQQILRLLERGHPPVEAARRVGVPVQRLWGATRLLPDFAAAVDAAIPCIAGQASGTDSGYRKHGCRCVDCRRARYQPQS